MSGFRVQGLWGLGFVLTVELYNASQRDHETATQIGSSLQ